MTEQNNFQDTPQRQNLVTSPFDAIRHLAGEREFWLARELSKVLNYDRWKNFEKVIAKAKIACKFNGDDVDLNFREVTKIARVGSRRAERSICDVELAMPATSSCKTLTRPSLLLLTQWDISPCRHSGRNEPIRIPFIDVVYGIVRQFITGSWKEGRKSIWKRWASRCIAKRR